jgi:sensor histidine kinase YesM
VPVPSGSTKVGLANITERLAQAFGDDQRMEAGNQTGGGFAVKIDIPYRDQESA